VGSDTFGEWCKRRPNQDVEQLHGDPEVAVGVNDTPSDLVTWAVLGEPPPV